MKLASITAVVFFSAAALASAAGLEQNKALSSSGLALPEIEIPSPPVPQKSVLPVNQVACGAPARKDAPRSAGANLNAAKRKLRVNQAQPDMDDTLIGLVQRGQDIDKAVKELTGDGFKVKAYQDNYGGCLVMADVTGLDAADYAIGLARYYYITEVRVGQKTYDRLFDLPSGPGFPSAK